ncbi:MAG TPA: His/Gly/Thr/Pro-type tRNA ligase C-terminal domain-containing protein, partial [Acidobacteriota bacterium]|nr:His/Gly/Thr/Pro-type tRNA ligase C-terminal domain-containing protein [Acidobacteriota bacterium]
NGVLGPELRGDDLEGGLGVVVQAPDLCAVGFAMGMERLLAVADIAVDRGKFLYIAHLGDDARKAAMTMARQFRRAGIECLVEYKARGLKAHLGRASKLEASWVLIVGDDELRAGRFPLKEMASGTQTEATPEELIEAVKAGA